MKLTTIINGIVLAYGTRFPYHPGKWRIVDALDRIFRLRDIYGGRVFTVRRMNLLWRLTPDCLMHRRLYYLATYEVRETAWLRRQIQPEWIFLDVGANCGYFSLLVSSVSHGSAEVHAFEPSSETFSLLEQNRKLNGFDRIYLHKMVISDAEGEIEFVKPPAENTGLGRIRVSGELSAVGDEKVRATTLDSFVGDRKLARVDFIKIDVEGAESLVLKGAEETIRRFHPMMMIEINPESLQQFKTSGDDLLEQIRGLGYDLFLPGRSRLHPLHSTAGIGTYVNVICIPTQR